MLICSWFCLCIILFSGWSHHLLGEGVDHKSFLQELTRDQEMALVYHFNTFSVWARENGAAAWAIILYITFYFLLFTPHLPHTPSHHYYIKPDSQLKKQIS